MNAAADYGDEHIRTLDWKEHIRRRPGMYIGKLGDGTSADDGIYILIKEVLDNSIDEYMMGSTSRSGTTAACRCATTGAAFRSASSWTSPRR